MLLRHRRPALNPTLRSTRIGAIRRFVPVLRAPACSVAVLWAAGALALSSAPPAAAQPAGSVLPAGTLPVLRGVVSGQVLVNRPAPGAERSLLTIDQTSSRAVIDWRSFNIGSGSEVLFNQPGTTASVLNRIYSADPTLIQGKLSSAGPLDAATGKATAGGQIILINQNGILFDRGAQVNAYSLVASTLNISNDFFARGLLAGDNASRPEAAFAGGYSTDGDGRTDPSIKPQGAIRIGSAGATGAAAPSLTTPAGGSILLFAPVIDNRNGLIAAPDGQVILAAGSKVYLSAEKAQAEGLRGFLVEVSAEQGDVNLSSLVRNQGTVTADRGNVTLAGLAINQEGRVSASTATLYNGSIWLKAATKEQVNGGPLDPARAGTVTLGPNSVTATPLDTTDTTTLAESQVYASSNLADDRRGRVRVEGGSIVQQGLVQAPGGVITMQASSPVAGESGRIYLAENSRTDAAGNWAEVGHDNNFATFRVTSTELKDAPDQKNGILKGATVTVDLRKSSSILDISGYVEGQRRSLGEKAASGGTVELSSSGDVIQRPNAVVDVSGGGYLYAGGTTKTTQLLGDDGKVYDIASAPQQRSFTAQLDKFTVSDARWGQTRVYDNPLGGLAPADPAYVEGKPGGSLLITAPTGLVLDGLLKGGSSIGPSQGAKAPAGATLTLGTDTNFTNTAVPVPALRFSAVAGDRLGSGFGPASVLPAAVAGQVELAASTLFPAAGPARDGAIESARFGRIEINSRGRVELPADVQLDAGIGSALVLRGNEIEIAGSVRAPAGSLVLQGRGVPGSDPATTPEGVHIARGASLSTAGLWLNNSRADGSPVGPALPTGVTQVGTSAVKSTIEGGTISISGSSFDAEPDSTLDVSGGGSVARGGRISAGNGGSLTLAANRSAVPASNRAAGNLLGYSLGTGGSLSLSVNQAQVGGEAAVADTVLRLDPDFFTQGGFSAFSLASAQGLTVMPGTQLRPSTTSWLLSPEAAVALPSGAELAAAATRGRLPDDLRRAASLSLSASGSPQANAVLTVSPGASIVVEPRGNITLDAVNGLNVDGRVEAPAGNITLTLRGGNATAPVLRLGADARLLASGSFIAKPADNGLRQGSVLAGGTVSATVTRGSIVAEAGSLIDVSGTATTLDFASTDPLSPSPVARSVASSAGSVVLRAQERTTLAGELRGQAGGAGSAGGSFALEFTNRAERLRPADVSVDRRIIVTQAPSTLPAEAGVVDAAIDGNRLFLGGFDKLRLQSGGRIEVRGQTSLDFERSIQLDTPEIRLADGARLNLESASLVLANSFGSVATPAFQGSTGTRNNLEPSRPVATRSGSGVINARAETIDVVGDVTLNGVARSTLVSEGDLRLSGRVIGDAVSAAGATLSGSLVSAGDITLAAAQVLPTTRSTFTVAVQSRSAAGATSAVAAGVLTVRAAGASPGDPLSADGALTLRADRIVQAGTVRAPLGRIALDAGSTLTLAAGSVTSVSAVGLTLPYGSTVDQRDWLYAPTNARADLNALTVPPSKRIALTAPAIDIASGATVDLSGGGNLQAYEFVPGSGGSADTLLKDNTFAILPAARLTSAPVDRQISAGKDLGLGPFTARPDALTYDAVHIGAGAAVPEGDYMLLPGRYALLPGAYLVTLQTGSAYAKLQPGQTAGLANGQVVVPGYRKIAGTSVREDATVGIVVRPGSAALRESDYALADASFFADRADRLREVTPVAPADAGRLAVAATASLKLDGNIVATAATAQNRAAAVDISAPRIAVVDSAASNAVDASFLKIEAASLSRIGGSLLLGGTRTDTASGVRLTASASEVVLANASTPLEAPELLIAASDQISARAGSIARGTGTATGSTTPLTADSSGALVRLSSGAAVPIGRTGTALGDRGSVTVAAGATLGAAGSLAIDATRALRLDGTLDVAAQGAVALTTRSISLGAANPDTSSSGLVLSEAALRRFDALDSLTLKSYGDIEFVGNVALGASSLGSLTLDTRGVRAVASNADTQASISAGAFTFRNSGDASTAAGSGAGVGAGRLTVDAQQITLAEGSKLIDGFGQVELRSSTRLVGSGTGSLTSAAPTTLSAARIEGTPGSDQTWRAAATATSFDLSLTSRAAATPPLQPLPEAPAGAKLALEGRSVALGTAIALPSGELRIEALGTQAADGVSLGGSGAIDVSGASKSFADRVATANAGAVTLRAAAGAVVAQPGSKMTLAAAAGGGNAGRLDIAAASVQLLGAIDARAATAASAGRVSIDVASLNDFSSLNARLNEAGFAEQVALRVRTGDLRVAAADTLQARRIELAADAGRIDVAGKLDASGAGGGGSVGLYAATGMAISGQVDLSGKSTDPAAAAAPADGGVFTADVRAGSLVLAASATVDVRGGAKGSAGRAEFIAPQTAGNGVAVDLRGSVLTQRSPAAERGEVVVSARRVVSGVSEVGAAQIESWADQHTAFMRGVDTQAVTGSLRTDGSPHVRSLLELQGPADINFSTDWDLSTSRWLSGSGSQASEPGRLSVRAAGDINVRRSIGLADDQLVAASTWSLQFAAGADLGAAQPLALRPLAALGALGAKGNFVMRAADAPRLVDLLDPSGIPVLDPNTGETAQQAIDQVAKIRTGTGSIAIAAGRDFVFETGTRPEADAKRVIYTAGRPTAAQDPSAFVAGIATPWADGGGDISILAQRDAVGSSNQAVGGWLRRPRGSVEDSGEGAWFVYRPNFQQNVGALGGGDVSIAAGNDVMNLSAAVPTMGRVTTAGGTRTLAVTGGGDLAVVAGGRIEGGDYLVGRGTGTLSAGASVGASTPTQLYLMGISDGISPAGARISVSGRTGVRLQSVDNPTALTLPQSRALGPQQFRAELNANGQPEINPETATPYYLPVDAQNFADSTQNAAATFYTYAADTALSVQAASGDITLGGQARAKPSLALPAGTTEPAFASTSAYPGQVQAQAFAGQVQGTPDRPLITLFPSPRSGLSLLAASDVGLLNLFASDRALASVAAWDRPAPVAGGLIGVAASTPREKLDPAAAAYRYDVVAQTGSVRSLGLIVPDRARVLAGLDIAGGGFSLQNQGADDVSVLRAVQGDVRASSISIGGPGALLVQAGRNIDAGTNAIQALGNTRNNSVSDSQSARMVFIAGVPGDVDLSKLDGAFSEFTYLNKNLNQALDLYRLLDAERDSQKLLQATSIADLAQGNPAYQPFVELGTQAPRVLGVYQDDLRSKRLPLGTATTDATAALSLYAQLNLEQDEARLRQILAAPSIPSLAAQPGFGGLAVYAGLDQQYPTLFSDYKTRRTNGFLPISVLPIVYGAVLDESVAKVFPAAKVARGSIDSFLTSVQTIGGSGIDLIAPAGDITVGLTTPRPGREVGVITTGGGGIRSYLSGNFNINQGKVVTAQGGDILIFTNRGNIDAGRGARTSQTSPAPVREPVIENGVVVGFTTKIPAGFSGSGIQTLSSDPDGQGPQPAARAGAVLLFTPAGFVDAGEAGIVSGGDLVIVAQTVLNAANISASGASVGVPVAAAGSLASSLASGGSNTAGTSKSGEDAASASASAARAAAGTTLAKPTILVVEVLGFGDKNCKEQDKDCFAK